MIPYHQISISCFLIDLDPISKVSKISLNNLRDLPGPVFSKIDKDWIPRILKFISIIFSEECSWDPLILFRYPGVSKDKK